MATGAVSGIDFNRRRAPSRDAVSPALTIEGALLLFSIVGSWFASSQFIDPAWSLVSLVNFTWMIIFLFRVEPRGMVLLIPTIVSRLSTVVALIFIEFGSPIPELGTVGTPGPFSTSYNFYTLLMFGIYILVFRIFSARLDAKATSAVTRIYDHYAGIIVPAVLSATGIIILWLILRGLVSGFPLLQGVDRFFYRYSANDKVLLYALLFKYVIAFALGMIAFIVPTNRVYRLLAVAAMVFITLLYFLFADKFFSQIASVATFFAPYMVVHYEKVRRYIVLWGLGSAAMFAVAFGVTWNIYSGGGASTPAATMTRLSGRVAGQGELWYVQARIGAPMFGWDTQFIRENIAALTVKDINLYAIQNSLGPNYFSNRYAPNNIRAAIQRNAGNVTYTSAFEPLGLAIFGWMGLGVLMAVSGIILALSSLYLAFAIKTRSILSAIFSSYIGIQVRTVLAQATPWVLFGVFSLKWNSVIFVIEILILIIGSSQRSARSRYAG